MSRSLAIAEWQHARRSLRAAELLLREDCFEDAVSRAYYASLHAAKAALHLRGVAADSHAAVKRMFGLHLVRSGEIETEWSAHLNESLDDRLAADYDSEASFSLEDARHECRRTRQFLARIRRHLLEGGLTPGELRARSR